MKQGTIPLILPQIPSVESLHILSSCLTLDEKERISISELVSHPFTDHYYKTTPIFQKQSEGKIGRQMTCPKVRSEISEGKFALEALQDITKFNHNLQIESYELLLSCNDMKINQALGNFLAEQ
jgi:serine/threonine protein kinase